MASQLFVINAVSLSETTICGLLNGETGVWGLRAADWTWINGKSPKNMLLNTE